jgi:hypothetical protein
MTALDMDALSQAQRDVLGLVAVGDDVGHNPITLAALEAKGLVVARKQLLPGVAGMWPGNVAVEVTRWHVPLPVHMQWCEWCAAQPDEGKQ